jgi:AAA+ superfamily predicted ATPase
LLICATNHLEVIDIALTRRFQLKIGFEMPSPEALNTYYEKLLSQFPTEFTQIERKFQCSFAEAKDYALTAVKQQIIASLEQ